LPFSRCTCHASSTVGRLPEAARNEVAARNGRKTLRSRKSSGFGYGKAFATTDVDLMHRDEHADVYSLAVLAAAIALMVSVHAQDKDKSDQGFRFKSGVELINVTATVSDANGRFVPGLRQDDFLVYEDDSPVEVTHFSPERVPVSLGIALDTSGSMAGDKMDAARGALIRFVDDLLDRSDELFLYRFSSYPVLVQGWTNDRRRLLGALDQLTPSGGTAMYDAVSDAIPLAQQGQNRKKALVVISDGNDTASRLSIRDLKQQIRESEVLVYAIGIDGEGEGTVRRAPLQPPRIPMPIPLPFPGVPGGQGRWPPLQPPIGGTGGGNWQRWTDDRVNVAALRDMTDDSGGRTEIVRNPRDLDPATAGIADELRKQYYLGYTSPGKKDGRWHAIRVEVKNHAYRVRSRRGYVAN
jgi:Ca-activated chloride channel family protein